MGDRGLGERDDLGRRAVIDVELEDPRVGVTLGEFQDVVIIGASEPIDRLGIVAHRCQVARAGRRDRLDHLDLNGVRILHLVDQNMLEHPTLKSALFGKLADQAGPLQEQIVVVHAVGSALALGVARGGRLDLRLPLHQLRIALGDDLGKRTVHVGTEADHVVHRRRLGSQLTGAGQAGVIHRQPDQVELVLTIEDRKIGLVAQERRRASQQTIADVMERTSPDLGRRMSDQRFHPPKHFPAARRVNVTSMIDSAGTPVAIRYATR